MIFFFPRWDMLIPWRVALEKFPKPNRKGLSSNHHFSGVNSLLNFGGVSLTKPGMIHAHHVSPPVNLMDSVCRKPVALLRDTYRLLENGFPTSSFRGLMFVLGSAHVPTKPNMPSDLVVSVEGFQHFQASHVILELHAFDVCLFVWNWAIKTKKQDITHYSCVCLKIKSPETN